MRRVWGFALALALGALEACGGAAAPGAGPATPAGYPTPQGGAGGDVDTLTRELQTAERDLDANLAPAPVAATPPGAAPPANGAEKPDDTGVPPPAPAPTTPPSQQQAASGCMTACRALASMHRSQERICELTAPDAERCTWARQRVADAEERVKRAGCSC